MSTKKYVSLNRLSTFLDNLRNLFATVEHNHDSSYDAKGSANDALEDAKFYTDEVASGKADTSHTHNYAGSSSVGGAATSANKLNTDAGSVTQPVYFADGIPMETNYTLGKSVPSDAVFTDTTYNEATHADAGLLSAEDKIQLDNGGIPIVTTSGSGSAYIATVNGLTLTTGVSFIMIPHVVSTSTAPTLNVNGLGAKNIRRRMSNSTTSTTTGYNSSWLAVNKPVRVEYDGTYWIADLPKPSAADISGTISISKGGTGATDAATAITNLGITATSDELNYVSGATSNIQTQLNELSEEIDSSTLLKNMYTVENLSNSTISILKNNGRRIPGLYLFVGSSNLTLGSHTFGKYLLAQVCDDYTNSDTMTGTIITRYNRSQSMRDVMTGCLYKHTYSGTSGSTSNSYTKKEPSYVEN